MYNSTVDRAELLIYMRMVWCRNSLVRTIAGASAITYVCCQSTERKASDSDSGNIIHSDSSTPFQRYGSVLAATENTFVVGTNTYDSSAAVYVYTHARRPSKTADDAAEEESSVEEEDEDIMGTSGADEDTGVEDAGGDATEEDEDIMGASGADEDTGVEDAGGDATVDEGGDAGGDVTANTHAHSYPPLQVLPGRRRQLATADPDATDTDTDSALWFEAVKLLPAGASEFTGFGSAVALLETTDASPSGDTTTITTSVVVGSPAGGPKEDGQVYVYSRSRIDTHNTTGVFDWDSVEPGGSQMLAASDRQAGDLYGCSVSVVADLLLVGAKNRGADGVQSGGVYLYTRDKNM